MKSVTFESLVKGELTQAEFDNLNISYLKDICKQAGIPVKGIKPLRPQIIKRMREARAFTKN